MKSVCTSVFVKNEVQHATTIRAILTNMLLETAARGTPAITPYITESDPIQDKPKEKWHTAVRFLLYW